MAPTLKDTLSPIAMILAAGLGKRLRPITETMPKPLVKVAGKALLDHALDHVREGAIQACVVNSHYLADQLHHHLDSIKDLAIQISYEPDLLDSGGGIKKALPWLGTDPVFVLNADTHFIHKDDPVLDQLLKIWDPERMDALLLVVPQSRAFGHEAGGDFECHTTGYLTRSEPTSSTAMIYTGIQLIKPQLFQDIQDDIFSLNIIWDALIAQGRLFGCVGQGDWYHISTPASLAMAQNHLASPLASA